MLSSSREPTTAAAHAPDGATALRLTLAYDGTGFSGYARQPGRRTIQGELERALGALYDSYDELHVAGRTDAGVHASGQVVSVRVESGPPFERAARAIEGRLPKDIAVVAADPAPVGFHARHSARARAYRYRVRIAPGRDPFMPRQVAHVPYRIDLPLFRECIRLSEGRHDFRAFTPSETQHTSFTRTILSAHVLEIGDEFRIELVADAFLRHQVRTLVGTSLEVARGWRSLPDFRELLDGVPRSRGGQTAPPWGLTLVGIRYQGEPVGSEWGTDRRRLCGG